MTHAIMPAFDTLKYAESLQTAGVPEAQAKAHARAAADAYDVQLQRLATKDDLRSLASDLRSETTILRSEMTELRSEFRSELKLIKWISVTTAAAVLSQIAKGFM
jgi:hypothetical protein